MRKGLVAFLSIIVLGSVAILSAVFVLPEHIRTFVFTALILGTLILAFLTFIALCWLKAYALHLSRTPRPAPVRSWADPPTPSRTKPLPDRLEVIQGSDKGGIREL